MTQPLVQLQRAPHIQRAIDNTSLAAYMRCPREFYYSMIRNRRKGGPPSPALAYGSLWHKILETHYRYGGDYDQVLHAVANTWKGSSDPTDYRSAERCLSAYEAYMGQWGDHDTEARGFGRTLGFPDNAQVELVTEVSWPGAFHPYTVKIDRIFEHQGLFFVEDHKSSSQLGASYFRQWDPSSQMMGYAAIAQLLTGLPIAGVRINAHGVLKTQNKFERQTIHYNPERLEEWTRNYNVWVKRIDTSLAILDEYAVYESTTDISYEDMLLEAFPHNFNACGAERKYGTCPYVDVCTMTPRLRDQILDAEYSEDAWNPLADVDETEI